MNQDWSKEGVSLIVADYFAMLRHERQHQTFSKTEHRKALIPQLDHQTDGSVEFKHQNISAVLVNIGRPYMKGYLPRGNYQQILEDDVIAYLDRHKSVFEPLFEAFAEQAMPSHSFEEINFASCLEKEPERSVPKIREPRYRTIKVNYLEKEQNNRTLGTGGEQFVMNYEKWRLQREGRSCLDPQ